MSNDWYVQDISRYIATNSRINQCREAVWLDRLPLPTGRSFLKVGKVKCGPFFTWRQFSQKPCFIAFSLFWHEGTEGLPKDGLDWIALKVICQDPKDQKKVKFWYFSTLWQFSQKLSNNFSLSFAYSFLGMILINCQEMDLIELFKRWLSR